MEMKRQEHTVNSNRHVSPHVLQVYRLLWRIHQRLSNTTKSKSGLSLWRTSQNNSKNFFIWCFANTRIARQLHLSPKFFWGKNNKWIHFDLFFGPWPWPDPPPQDPSGRFLRQLAHVILGGSPFKLTWQVELTSCHLSSDLKRGRKRGWQVNLTSATCQVQLDKRNLSSSTCAQNTSVGPWKNSIIKFSRSEFPADFSTKETYEKRCTGKPS